MTVNDVAEKIAHKYGFEDIYFIPSEMPGEAVAILVYPYAPFDDSEYIPAYYLASNASYHALSDFTRELCAQGIHAENIFIHIKQAAEAAKLGIMGKNSLLHMRNRGSRVVLYSVAIQGAVAQEYDALPTDICANCDICIKSCPTGALTSEGFCRDKCLRQYMDEPPYPDFVEENIKTYLGCEICMQVCPYNAHLQKGTVSDEIREAFLPENVIANPNSVKQYVGRNIKSSRLKADAQALIKRRK